MCCHSCHEMMSPAWTVTILNNTALLSLSLSLSFQRLSKVIGLVVYFCNYQRLLDKRSTFCADMYCVRLSDGTNLQCWFVQSCLYDMLSYSKLMFWRIVPRFSKLWELRTGRHTRTSQTTCQFSNTAVTASSISHMVPYIPVQLSGCSLHISVGTNNIVSNYV
jgi:hypothetical protein